MLVRFVDDADETDDVGVRELSDDPGFQQKLLSQFVDYVCVRFFEPVLPESLRKGLVNDDPSLLLKLDHIHCLL